MTLTVSLADKDALRDHYGGLFVLAGRYVAIVGQVDWPSDPGERVQMAERDDELRFVRNLRTEGEGVLLCGRYPLPWVETVAGFGAPVMGLLWINPTGAGGHFDDAVILAADSHPRFAPSRDVRGRKLASPVEVQTMWAQSGRRAAAHPEMYDQDAPERRWIKPEASPPETAPTPPTRH